MRKSLSSQFPVSQFPASLVPASQFLVSLFLGSLAPLAAQTTWLVDPFGGPGVQFTDVQSAVNAAADGDTILVQQAFLAGATGFTTSKGLTIVGIGGGVPLDTTHLDPVRVTGLPATSTFRMSGFRRISNGMLHLVVENCAGPVHLDQIVAQENANGPEFGPSLQVYQSDQVTVRECVLFGGPAVQVDSSRVLLSSCQLGMTQINLGGGECLTANHSQVEVVAPRFDTGVAVTAAVQTLNSDLIVAGAASSHIRNGPVGPLSGGYAIVANGGSVVYDPRIEMSLAFPWGVAIAGTASKSATEVSGTWAQRAPSAPDVTVATVAPAGAFVGMAIGAPRPLASTPLGVLGIDPLQPYGFLPVATAPAGGVVTTTLPIAPTLTLGTAYAVQAAVLAPGLLELSLPSTFVVF